MQKDLEYLGVWLPAGVRRRFKAATAMLNLKLNQAARQALEEWMARHQPNPAAESSGEVPVAAPAATRRGPSSRPKPAREPGAHARTARRQTMGSPAAVRQALSDAAAAMKQMVEADAKQGRNSTSPAPADRNWSRQQLPSAEPASGETSPPMVTSQAAASRPDVLEHPTKGALHDAARKLPDYGWLHDALTLDWSACPAVEAVETKRGEHVWIFRGTHTTLRKLFRPLQDGRRMGEVAGELSLDRETVRQVMFFAAERLAPEVLARWKGGQVASG